MVDGTVFEMWRGGGTMSLPSPPAQVLWSDRAEERKKGHGGAVPIVLTPSPLALSLLSRSSASRPLWAVRFSWDGLILTIDRTVFELWLGTL